MLELPVRSDPEVLEHLYAHFTHLRGYPLRLQGSFIEDAAVLSALQAGDFLGFLTAYDEVRDSYPADFPFLTKEENASLTCQRLLRPAEPWPQPTIEVLWGNPYEPNITLDVQQVDVVLRDVGTVQLWYGDETGVIWEAFYDNCVPSGTGPSTNGCCTSSGARARLTCKRRARALP